MSGVFIQPNSTYTLSAAIGEDFLPNSPNQFWSLQLWADTDGSGVFEGTGFDTFITQQFGTNSTANHPTAGLWALNSVSFTTDDNPLLAGQQLVVFLNNFSSGSGGGNSYYDNVTLTAVPEPGTLLLLVVGLVGWFLLRRRTSSTVEA